MVAALSPDVKIWVRIMLRAYLIVRDKVCTGIASQGLQEEVQAVGEMGLMCGWEWAIGLAPGGFGGL